MLRDSGRDSVNVLKCRRQRHPNTTYTNHSNVAKERVKSQSAQIFRSPYDL